MRILLATDGSEYSVEAAKECRRLISHIDNVKVKIITVLDNFTPMATEPFITSEEFLANIESQMREHNEKTISDAKEILQKSDRVLDIETEILVGSSKYMIVKEAEEWNADLIIVGSHGYGFWARTMLGSVSDAIVHNAPCSVLVVRKPSIGQPV